MDYENQRSDVSTGRAATEGQGRAVLTGGTGKMAVNQCEDKQAYQDPLRVRVERRLTRISHDAEALMRVQAILNAHPEFEQLIELQNLINRHGL